MRVAGSGVQHFVCTGWSGMSRGKKRRESGKRGVGCENKRHDSRKREGVSRENGEAWVRKSGVSFNVCPYLAFCLSCIPTSRKVRGGWFERMSVLGFPSSHVPLLMAR